MIEITTRIKDIISKAALGFTIASTFAITSSYADSSVSWKNNDLGPFAAFSTFTQIGKFSYFLGEAEVGAKHQKLSTTFTTFLGWNREHGLKGTLQYLRQKPTVEFFDKNRDIWVQQGSLGLEYLYVYSNTFQFNASGYYGFIPEESVTINDSNTINTIFGNNTVTLNSNEDVEIGKIVQGHQFGGWVGFTYTPTSGTLFRAKLVCDFLNRDISHNGYFDDDGSVNSRKSTISSCGGGATVQFGIYDGLSFRFDTDITGLQQRYNPELTWAPDFVDNMRFSLGGRLVKADYEGNDGGFYNYYLKMFYEF